ncbi:MarR family transcriptional regulator [Agromyces protaetiae]|uniref:MarR family transcriptional regulator n=1 Tax=Agromyces protaetiae TaxID=2509455 RepID=A0A4P6FGJ7_9MICO|nr:MarR family winged helix-turn-helix transcriptional regulator [Agromyces protaetiae]QAY72967.1 MarR family transcriptional regulator [Agromyces protaetiae]
MMGLSRRGADASGILRDLIVISRRGIADARTARVKLSMTDQSILAYIADHDGARAVDIASTFRLNRSTVSRQLANLVNLGIVCEKADEGDALRPAQGAGAGRGRPLQLTEAGRAAYNDGIDILQHVVDDVLHDWTDEEVARFAHDLARFTSTPTGARPRNTSA